MARIRLNLKNLTVTELADYAQRIERSMTKVPAFASSKPNLALLPEEMRELLARQNAYDAAISAVERCLTARDLVRDSLESLLTDLAEEVARVADDDPAVIQKSGFEARRFPRVARELPAELSADAPGFASPLPAA